MHPSLSRLAAEFTRESFISMPLRVCKIPNNAFVHICFDSLEKNFSLFFCKTIV